MSSFITPLVVKIHTKNPRERELFLPFTYITKSGDKITVPAGFFTNFASVPRILWGILPQLDHYGKAAVIHDYLYRTPNLQYTRKQADNILKDACEDLNVKPWKTWALYSAVRLFGWHAWGKTRDK